MGVNVEIQVLYTEIPKEKPYAGVYENEPIKQFSIGHLVPLISWAQRWI